MPQQPTTIWTIGHSTRSIEEFIALLKQHDLRVLADVRRFPGSRRYPQFGQAELSRSLDETGIEYVHLPELGGRRSPSSDSPNTAWRNAGFRGYADYMMTDSFREAMKRLLQMTLAKRAAVMCAEAVWWQCHRALIADYLKAAGHTVVHIIGGARNEEHPYTSAARILNGRLTYAMPA